MAWYRKFFCIYSDISISHYNKGGKITVFTYVRTRLYTQNLEIQPSQTHYNLRHTSHFSTDSMHSVYNGTESTSYLGPKIWEQIPAEIKNKDFLDGFKKEIKNGNLLSVHVEFVRLLCQIQVLFDKNISISRFEISSF